MQSLALWLFGLSGVLLLAGVVVGASRPRLHLLLEGDGDKRRDRLKLALDAAGVCCAAVGSTILMVTELPAPLIALGTVLGVAAVIYIVMTVRLRQLWTARLGEALTGLLTAQHSARAQWEVEASRLCRRWRWVLLNPFAPTNASTGPDEYLKRHLGPAADPPPRSGDVVLDAKFAQISRNLAALEDAVVPEWIRDIVGAARAAGFQVLRAGDLIVFYPPAVAENRNAVCEPGTAPARLVRNLQRQRLLEQLRDRGLPVITTPLGWSTPAVRHADGSLSPAWACSPKPDQVAT